MDGCQVFPHTSGETSGSMRQTLIPLNNNSIFEIHGKRFKFNYPPKELRKALYSTPARKHALYPSRDLSPNWHFIRAPATCTTTVYDTFSSSVFAAAIK